MNFTIEKISGVIEKPIRLPDPGTGIHTFVGNENGIILANDARDDVLKSWPRNRYSFTYVA